MAQHHGGPNVSPALMCEQYKPKTTHHAGSSAGILKQCKTHPVNPYGHREGDSVDDRQVSKGVHSYC